MSREGEFAPGALRLAGLACRALGWRPSHFWDATPAEMASVLAPQAGGDPAPLGRAELERMMEDDRDG